MATFKQTFFRLAMATALASAALAPTPSLACNVPDSGASLEAGLLNWINAERADRGLSPYKRSGKLDRAAEYHACDMATHSYFAHARSGGPGLGQRIKSTGYKLKAGNENIAYSRQAKVASAAGIWRNSPPHWAAIIDPSLKDIGIAITMADGKIYWVMDVARPKGS